jgi:hypothetical protein
MNDLTDEERDLIAKLRLKKATDAVRAKEKAEREQRAREEAEARAREIVLKKAANDIRLTAFLDALRELCEEYGATFYGGEGVEVIIGAGDAMVFSRDVP